MPFDLTRRSPRSPRAPWIVVAVVVTLCVLAGQSGAASSGTVVGATVPSATTIDPAGCGSLVANKTHFGSVLPDTSTTTSIDCSVAFGSSNDTAQLRVRQGDSLGSAMWMPTTGRLDQAFDGDTGTGNGWAIHPITANTDATRLMAVQPDEKVVVAGECTGSLGDFCVTRFNVDGSVDLTFDGPSGTGNGSFLLSPSGSNDWPASIDVQPDGRILLAGLCVMGTQDLCFYRLMPNGTLDASFDGPSGTGNGFVSLARAGSDIVRNVLVQEDGRIFATGSCSGTPCALRLNSDGTLDSTFDGPTGTGNGIFTMPELGTTLDLEQDSSGRLLVVGERSNGTNLDFSFTRLLADGTFDTTFDGPSGTGNGFFLVAPGTNAESAIDTAIGADGRITTLGLCQNAPNDRACLVRLLPSGALDPTFDGPAGTGNGMFIDALGNGGLWNFHGSLDLTPDGRVLIAGDCWTLAGDNEWCFTRYLEDGSVDTTFDGPGGSGNGRISLAMTTGDWMEFGAMRAKSDGRIVAAGLCSGAASLDPCVLQLDQGGSVSDYVTGGGSDTDWASGPTTNMFAACLRSVSGGATAQWTANATCPASDGAYWNDVPTAPEKVAYTTALEPDPPDATANFRFGFRTSSNQQPGAYVAPITFDVLAPNA